jgi:hypothetical protein
MRCVPRDSGRYRSKLTTSIWDKYKDVYARHRTKELTLVG